MKILTKRQPRLPFTLLQLFFAYQEDGLLQKLTALWSMSIILRDHTRAHTHTHPEKKRIVQKVAEGDLQTASWHGVLLPTQTGCLTLQTFGCLLQWQGRLLTSLRWWCALVHPKIPFNQRPLQNRTHTVCSFSIAYPFSFPCLFSKFELCHAFSQSIQFQCTVSSCDGALRLSALPVYITGGPKYDNI